MLSGAKHLVFSRTCEDEILRLSPQDDFARKYLTGRIEEGVLISTSAVISVSPPSQSSPIDGGRASPELAEGLGWGCKSASESPPPLSSHVRGEESDGQKAPHSSLIAAFFLIGLLFLATHASAQLKTIRLCAPGLGSGIMHAYIAKERGYFGQEGLDFDVLVTRGQICTMALLNGQMELSSNPNVFDAMVAGRFKGKVIYVSAKTLGHRFIVAPEIKTFDGLKQKNIAVSTFGGLTDMLTREILEQHGINPAKDVILL